MQGQSVYGKIGRLIGLAVLFCSCQANLKRGLVANYPFNGNTKDKSANHFDAHVYGASLTTDRKGKHNSAYFFDGVDDYIAIPHRETFNFPDKNFTISVWVQVNGQQNNANSGIDDIVRKWNGDTQGYPFSISYLDNNAAVGTQNKILLARYDGSICRNAPNVYSPAILDTIFHHVVFIKKETTVYLYLDGLRVAEAADITSCPITNTADVTIGRRGNVVRHFTGKIDDLRFYDRALTDDEISTLAHL